MSTEKKYFSDLYNARYTQPLPLNLFVFPRKFEDVHFSDELEPYRKVPFKIINESAEVTYEFITENGKVIHTNRNHLFPYSPKRPLLFPHIQSQHDQNPGTTNDSDLSDMIQNELYTLHDTFEMDGTVFDVDLL